MYIFLECTLLKRLFVLTQLYLLEGKDYFNCPEMLKCYSTTWHLKKSYFFLKIFPDFLTIFDNFFFNSFISLLGFFGFFILFFGFFLFLFGFFLDFFKFLDFFLVFGFFEIY